MDRLTEREELEKTREASAMRATDKIRQYQQDYRFYVRCLRVVANKPKLAEEIKMKMKEIEINYGIARYLAR